MLLAAGILVVAALLFATVAGMHPLLSAGKSGPILLIAIAIGAAALAAAMLHRAMHRYAKTDQSMATRNRRAAQEPADRRGHHQGRAAGAGVLGAGPGRARDGAYAGGVAGLPQQHAELLKFGKWLDLASAQELKKGPRRPVRRRPTLQPRCSRRRPAATSRRTAARPAGGRSCACATSPGASATSPGSSISTASSCAIPWPGAPCSTRCRCRPGSAAPTAACNGSTRPTSKAVEAGSESGGARAPDRAARDAPARGGRRRADQGHPLPRARAPHQRGRAQGARRRGHPARGRQRRRGHRRGGAGDGAGRAGAPCRRLRAHARPGGHRRRHLRPRPAPDVLQRGLPQAVAARRRLARHQADRRRNARPPARAVAAAGGGELPRLEGQDPGRLQDRHGVRGLVAPARRPHHPRRLGAAPRRRPHLSLRRRHRALRAREPLQRADRRAARDPRQPQGRRRGVRHRRPPQALQLGLAADLAPLAQHAGRRPAHRQDHRPVQRPLRRHGHLGAHQPCGHRHLRPAPAGGRPDDRAPTRA